MWYVMLYIVSEDKCLRIIFALFVCRPQSDQISIFVAVRGLSHVLLLLIIVAIWEGGYSDPPWVLRTCCRIPVLGLD